MNLYKWRQSSLIALLENLKAIIACICHDDTAAGVDSDIPRRLELTVSTSAASDDAQALAVTDAQHLHAVVFGVCHNNVALSVDSNSKRTAKKAIAAAFGTKRF